jgi:hypothetical protein
MANSFLGQVSIAGIPGTFTTTIANYVSPNALSGEVRHSTPAVQEIKDKIGTIKSAFITDDEALEWEPTLLPLGDDAAKAAKACSLPAIGSKVVVADMVVIAIGGFADALNGNWAYMGGGRIVQSSEGNWTLVMPLKRWKNITIT